MRESVYWTMVAINLDLYCICVDETVVWHWRLYFVIHLALQVRTCFLHWTNWFWVHNYLILEQAQDRTPTEAEVLQEAVPPWTQSLVHWCSCVCLVRHCGGLTWCVQARLLACSGCRQRTVNTTPIVSIDAPLSGCLLVDSW